MQSCHTRNYRQCPAPPYRHSLRDCGSLQHPTQAIGKRHQPGTMTAPKQSGGTAYSRERASSGHRRTAPSRPASPACPHRFPGSGVAGTAALHDFRQPEGKEKGKRKRRKIPMPLSLKKIYLMEPCPPPQHGGTIALAPFGRPDGIADVPAVPARGNPYQGCGGRLSGRRAFPHRRMAGKVSPPCPP